MTELWNQCLNIKITLYVCVCVCVCMCMCVCVCVCVCVYVYVYVYVYMRPQRKWPLDLWLLHLAQYHGKQSHHLVNYTSGVCTDIDHPYEISLEPNYHKLAFTNNILCSRRSLVKSNRGQGKYGVNVSRMDICDDRRVKKKKTKYILRDFDSRGISVA